MTSRPLPRVGIGLPRSRACRVLAGFAAVALLLSGCGQEQREIPPAPSPEPAPTSAIAPASAQVEEALAQFNRGAALMEQYKYAEALQAFDAVLAQFPDWTAARFNLALALLNMQDQSGSAGSLARAEEEFKRVLSQDPDNAYAHFGLGVYYQFTADNARALEHFAKVYELDPNDPFVGYLYSDALINNEQFDKALEVLAKVTAQDRGFVSAFYRLGNLYNRMRNRERAMEVFARFKELNTQELAVGSYGVRDPYAAKGKYYLALTADGLPVAPRSMSPAPRVVFSPETRAIGPKLSAWTWSGGEVQLPGIAVGDLDGDGDQDLIVCGAGGNGGVVPLFNDGDGQFESREAFAAQGVSPCLGDIDNDGDLDLWLSGEERDRIFRNDGKGAFTLSDAPDAPAAGTLGGCARLVDIDNDGDLDLLASRIAGGDVPPGPGHPLKAAPGRVWINQLDGTYNDQAEALGLGLAEQPITAILADDCDDDRDVDLVLASPRAGLVAWENYRVGQYRLIQGAELGIELPSAVSLTSGDPFKTGRRDLLVFAGDSVRLLRNRGHWRYEEDGDFTSRHGALGGTGGQFVDIDNDGDLDVLIPDARRKDGTSGPALLLNDWPQAGFVLASEADPGNLLATIRVTGPAAGVAADFNGDGRPDLLLAAAGQEPLLVVNATQGGQWLALDLTGKRLQDQTSRSPDSAIGARVELRAGTVMQQFVVGVPAGATASPPLRVHAGLGDHDQVQWLRVLWPDSILQAELELAANQVLPLAELCRRTTSCPHVFAWNGTHFAFISDFGGVGGLGYLVAPGTYAQPDATEIIPLPGLQPRDGSYVVQVAEPLEEVVYFDEAKLIAVDHPAGTTISPHEMAAVSAPPPPFEIFCYRDPIEPVSVTDHTGADVTAQLRKTDRVYAGATDPDPHYLGYAAPHAVTLDFGDQLADLSTLDRPILFVDGWVEYSTSTSNYAASQAGKVLQAPSIDVKRDGQWVELLREVGYPAGINHIMTLDLTGLVRPTDRELRIRSTMDLYWDRMFLALDEGDAGLTMQEIAAATADLHELGYPREFSPDGRKPFLLDYANIDRSNTWLRLPGAYTRFGDVRELIQEPDDRFAIMAPGDEITVRFDAAAFQPVPPGCVRTFLLKTDSYCKDMDLYTGTGDHLEPLPFHGMSRFPYGPDEHYPDDEAHTRYLREYNTRVIEPAHRPAAGGR